MNNDIETINYRGKLITTFYSEHHDSPDDWGNKDVFLVHKHRDFDVARKGFDPSDIYTEAWSEKKLMYDGYHIFPIYAYIHSGIALSLGRETYPFTCNWDTSFAGFMLVKKQKGWSYTRKKAYEIAQSECDTWNDYLSGSVYGYSSDSGSCSGFYGEEGYKQMIEEAKEEIDGDIKNAIKKHGEALKKWIKNKVDIFYRKPLQLV